MAAKATILSEEDIQNICKEYVETTMSAEKLALKYHVGKKRIVAILTERNVERKPRGGQLLKTKFVVSDWRIKKYPPVEGKHWEAVDKEDGFRSKDIDNESGILTSRVTKKYGIEPPLWHVRNKYYMETGNYWWEQWYDVELVDDKPTKKCPYCDWETVDVDNKGGWFWQHIKHKHGLTKQEHLKNHPEDINYFTYTSKHKNIELSEDENEYVICKVCGRKMGLITSSHLATHGMTKAEYREKFGDDDIVSKISHNKIVKHAIETNKNMTFHKQSKAEIEIMDYLCELGLYSHPDRKILKGKEIDIYIPSKKLGIEYNGLLWHSEWGGKKPNDYHYNKMIGCQEAGVSLFSIIDYEYEMYRDLVLSRFEHKLGCHQGERVYARNCYVKQITKMTADKFLKNNDIDGKIEADLNIGAFYNDLLVGVMSFNKKPDNSWILERVATSYDKICSGVCGKMFAYFKRNFQFNSIEVLGDRRWAFDIEDNLFTRLGFKYVEEVKPSYRYVRPRHFVENGIPRNILIKDKKYKEMKQMLNNNNKPNDEESVAKKLGYDRLWDCGYIKYIYKV